MTLQQEILQEISKRTGAYVVFQDDSYILEKDSHVISITIAKDRFISKFQSKYPEKSRDKYIRTLCGLVISRYNKEVEQLSANTSL